MYMYIYEKKLLKVKPHAEVLAFREYISSRVYKVLTTLKLKAHSMWKHGREHLRCCYGNASTLNIKMVTF